mgnify:CR=1 FL=1
MDHAIGLVDVVSRYISSISILINQDDVVISIHHSCQFATTHSWNRHTTSVVFDQFRNGIKVIFSGYYMIRQDLGQRRFILRLQECRNRTFGRAVKTSEKRDL